MSQPSPVKKLPLSSREQKVVDHLKNFRPKMYKELVASGTLESTARQMWRDYTDQWYELVVEKKLPANQAEELCRETAFPPSEKDQPNLGEDPAAKDPTTLTTTK